MWTDRARGSDPVDATATATAADVPEQEVAAIIVRAAAIGIPAWRVATALGVPGTGGASDGAAGPSR